MSPTLGKSEKKKKSNTFAGWKEAELEEILEKKAIPSEDFFRVLEALRVAGEETVKGMGHTWTLLAKWLQEPATPFPVWKSGDRRYLAGGTTILTHGGILI